MGFEPTISTVTGWHVNRYTTGPRAEEAIPGYTILVGASERGQLNRPVWGIRI